MSGLKSPSLKERMRCIVLLWKAQKFYEKDFDATLRGMAIQAEQYLLEKGPGFVVLSDRSTDDDDTGKQRVRLRPILMPISRGRAYPLKNVELIRSKFIQLMPWQC